jgi:hypothetical protein
MARNRTRTIFRFSLVFAFTHITAFLIGVNWGIMGLAVAFLITSTLLEPVLTVLSARVLGVSPMIFVRAVAGVFQAAGGMVAVLLLVRPALIDAGVPTGARLALLIAIGAIVYLPLCAWRAPEVVRDARSLLPARARRFVPVARTAES